MTLIESTYQRLLDYNAVQNSEDFSTRYLKRSKSYYRSIKAMSKQPSYEAMCNLTIELEKKVDENPRNKLFRQLSTETAKTLVDKINIRNVCSKTAFRVSLISVEAS